MEEKEVNSNKEEKLIFKEKRKNILNNKILIIVGVIILILVIGGLVFSKEGGIKIKVKSSLSKLVEKSDLETINFTYNVIAKQCNNENKCNKKSNNIDDFKYVISCKGTVTAGIDFDNVGVDVDKKNKKLIVSIPNAGITDITVGSMKFLNGEDLPSSELVNARRLCEETIREKSKEDKELLPAAKEQAEVVLISFYKQWLKSVNNEYKLEVK